MFRWFGTQTKVPSESIQVACSKMKPSLFLREKMCYQVSISMLWWFFRTPHRTVEQIRAYIQDENVQYFYLSEDMTPCTVKRTHGYMQLMNTWMFSKRCCSRIRDCFTEWYSHISGSKLVLAWGLLHVIWRLLPVVKLFQYLSLLKLSLLCRHDTRQQFNSHFWRVCFNRNS